MYCLLGNTDLSLQNVCKNTDIVPFEKERLDGGVLGLGILKLNKWGVWAKCSGEVIHMRREKGAGSQLDQKYNFTISLEKGISLIKIIHNLTPPPLRRGGGGGSGNLEFG